MNSHQSYLLNVVNQILWSKKEEKIIISKDKTNASYLSLF